MVSVKDYRKPMALNNYDDVRDQLIMVAAFQGCSICLAVFAVFSTPKSLPTTCRLMSIRQISVAGLEELVRLTWTPIGVGKDHLLADLVLLDRMLKVIEPCMNGIKHMQYS